MACGAQLNEASPGYPYMKRWKSSRDVPLDFIVEVCIQRVVLQGIFALEKVELLPIEKVQIGLADPIRLFVKNEPHKSEKRRTKRVRLIQSVSVVDNLLLTLVCGDQNKREIASWYKGPSCAGIGFTPEHVSQFLQHLPKGPYSHSDMSGWDWSVQGWELEMDFQMRALLEYGMRVKPTAYHAVLHANYENQAKAVFLLGDGRLVEQTEKAGRKTGGKPTASDNGRDRSMVHYMCGGKWNRAVGDDNTGDFIENYAEKALELGHRLRDADVSSDGFRLCSAWWDVKTGKLVHDIAKPLFNYLTGKRDPGQLEQFLAHLSNHPEESRVRQLLAEEWSGLSNAVKEEVDETEEEDPDEPDPEGAVSGLFL